MPVSMNFGTPPPELRAVAPYLARATELRKKEPIIAYYCLYYATQVGISTKTTQRESKTFLVNLMTTLEGLKEELKEIKEINSDTAASGYIEEFALKVFNNADAEDRMGGSSRSTAKKFLAAGNFLDVLKIFDKQEITTVDFEEKARYAKWKAADIAKAFREGRVPQAGPAYGDEYAMGERSVTPPSDFDDVSLSSSGGAGGSTSGAVPRENPSPRRLQDHNLPPVGIPKTPMRGPDGIWSTVATPGNETPDAHGHYAGAGAAAPISFAAHAALNTSQRDNSPKAKSGLSRVAASAPLKGDGEDTDPEDADDSWSTVGNPFSRQNSTMVFAGATPPASAGPGANFTTNLVSLNEEPSSQKSAAIPFSKPSNTQPVQIPLSKSPEDLNKQVRFTPDTSDSISSTHRRTGSAGSMATTTTMVTSGTTLRSPLSDYGSSADGGTLADIDDIPGKAGKAPSSPSETMFVAQLPTPPSTAPKAPAPGQQPSVTTRQTSGSSEDEWEQQSLSRIARLPDSRGSGDSDSRGSGGGGGDIPAQPRLQPGQGDSTPTIRDAGRRNTIRANAPPFNEGASSDMNASIPQVRLPGVPSAPPVGNWPGYGNDRGAGSDDGDLPSLPSAPPIAPSDQLNIPHVTVFTRPRPDNTVQANVPHAEGLTGQRPDHGRNPGSNSTYDQHLRPLAPPRQQSTSNPNSRVHSRAPSEASSGSGATVPTHLPSTHPQNYAPSAPSFPKPPSPTSHFQSPSSTTSSHMHAYAPPNSAISPTGTSPSASLHNLIPPPPPIPGQQYVTQPPPAPYAHQHQQYAADPYSGAWPAAGGYTNVNGSITPQSNGSNPSTGGYSNGSYFPNGAMAGQGGFGARTPPETLDPETVAKAQKHAKFAISALNFEDLETARKELRKALETLS